MKSGKKKSQGWQPSGKRRTPAEHQARTMAGWAATARSNSDRLERWRCCPARRCRRLGRCDSAELQCERRSRPATAPHGSAAPRAQNAAATPVAAASPGAGLNRVALPVLSAAEAAAVIKASIAAMPPEPFDRDDLEALIRAGRV